MQWEKGPSGNYLLVEDGAILATVSINHRSHSFRIACPASKRVLLLHKAGFWRHRTVLKNEYGHKIGQRYPAKPNNGGVLEFEGKRFRYKLHKTPLAEIVVLNEAGTVALLTCGLGTNTTGTVPPFKTNETMADAEEQYLLFALAWYLFSPVVPQSTPAHALSAAG
jgi:hypothetical protein